MKIKLRKGFTLVELIVVIAILGVVSAAIMTTFQFTTRSFSAANLRSQQQFETRMAMNLVKRELGMARNVIIRDSIPATLPAGGFCFYDPINHVVRLRTVDGRTFNLIATMPAHVAISTRFTPLSFGTGAFNTVRLDWRVGDYFLTTDVYIQNMAEHLGSVTTSYNISGNAPPGIFIQFN